MTPLEQRRIQLLNRTAMVGVFFSFAYASFFAVTGFERHLPLVVLNVIAMFGNLAVVAWAGRVPRTMGIASGFLAQGHIVAAALLTGRDAQVQAFFVVLVPIGFLLFPIVERPVYALLPLSSVALYVVLELSFPDRWVILAPELVLAVRISCVLGVLAAVTTLVFLFARDAWLVERQLADAHAVSEALLLNVLPASIAARLKTAPASIADAFDEVTVLFADLVGFTMLSATMAPAELVALLNRLFSTFDELAERHGLEKIKTIGDSYMAAAGLPDAQPDHAMRAARMALDIRDAVRHVAIPGLDIRIGIHTGPVAAGVIGKKKFTYDLWGDTVNLASRMESHGAPGRIQASAALQRRLQDAFVLVPRGVIEVKGKGPVETFWLESERP